MKKSLPVLVILLFFSYPSFSQVNLIKKWDHTFGGIANEVLNSLAQTHDGGFLLGGFTRSDSSGDVTQPTRGGRDYWVVKTDSLGNKQWDKRFGGNNEEKMFSFDLTNDGGFILGGYTNSDSSGDVSEHTHGSLDYWIVKIDSMGNKQWDKRYGGDNYEWLNSLRQTSDGGFILGGYTNSDSSGDVTQHSQGGEDYWIVKTDSMGNIEWDKRFGGDIADNLFDIRQTSDGGYIMGGTSASDSSGDVSQGNRGVIDFWVLKTDAFGNKQWDGRYGGLGKDEFLTLRQTFDGGYILGGYITSDSSGEVSEPTRDTTLIEAEKGDFWIVKIDSAGHKQWDKRFGGLAQDDAFGYINQLNDGGYLFGGSSYSDAGGDKSENNNGYEQSWIIRVDSVGHKLWDKTIFTNGEDEFAYPLQISDGCYVIGNWSYGDSAGYKSQPSRGNYDYWIVKFCETNVPQVPIANFTVSNPSICAGGCFTFNNLSYDAGSYLWLFPGGTPSTSTVVSPQNICYADTGQYPVSLIAYNLNGSDTITLPAIITIYPLPAFTIVQNGDTLLAPLGMVSYQWYQNNLAIPSDTNYYHVLTQDGSYGVLVSDANGCPFIDTVYAVMLGIQDATNPNSGMAVFPNPSRDKVTVMVGSAGGYFEITDLSGNRVMQQDISVSKFEIDLSRFVNGMYFLNVYQKDKQLHRKIVKD